VPTAKQSDEFISIDDVTVSPRGRKKVIDSALAEMLGKLKDGQAVRLSGKFGAVPREQRAAVSQVIGKHWTHTRTDDCRIDYTPEGVPQVRIKAKA
jgi:hypothetical protein